MLASVLERDPGSYDESFTVEDTTVSPASASAMTRAPGGPRCPSVSVDEIDFASVQAGSHVDADRAEELVDRLGASDRAGGTVEGCEESVTRRLHLSSFEPVERSTDELVVLGEELSPSGVSDLSRAVGQADDVGEEHGREHAIVSRSRAGSRDEVLDLAQEGVLVARPQQAAAARQLDVRCAGDPFGQVASVRGLDPRIRPSDEGVRTRMAGRIHGCPWR